MKAAIYHEFGEAEVIKFEDAEKPAISEDEVLVNVKSVSLNALDLRLRSGKSPRPVDLPHIGGIDIAGEISEVGANVSDLKVGDRVVVDPTVRLEKGFEVIGVNRHGGLAEYVKVPAVNVITIPEGLSFDDAAAAPICTVTAWYGLVERGNLKEGERVLVHAAGSGTGCIAVQIAKHLGASQVIATAGSDEKLAKAKELGADEVINYNTQDFAEEVKKITGGKGVNVIFDQIGASVYEKNIQSLSAKGRLLLVGVVGGVKAELMFGPLIMKDIAVLGVTVFNAPRSNLEKALKLTLNGYIKSVIDKKFPLAETAAAHKHIENRAQFGKVIVNP
ncbi:MAG: zinc-binding dehydrogenase [Candidatus Dadabacteria bacterium]|nr:zinc-binding dehydrogenase [Candidatus Dadabacteria bacterium]NIS08425.1 zinc-binding dehydrogenase [Candidatus Dadabacteria bacterium]NIV41990.1 zinc-binding dehydrogenase [Candidatus Dadabacteria bacterium]NIX15296.1 zinc-binding dehydrogenase [Candidatus Dadabacteria bacterium]NIY21913.1 zinc-binding dehydrogenase [Candidatus Dadabacteria bacterium]